MSNNNQLKNKDDTAALYLLEQAMGFTFQASLRAATILGVADHLKKEAKTAEEVGQTVGADSRQLNRVLRMLASRNIFAESADGRFSLTPAAQYLRSDHNDSLRAAVLMLTDKTFWLPLGNLVENLRGESAFKKAFGMSFYEYWSRDNIPESEGDFH
ncbi:methyltransferase family protein, partial [Yersinia enterocolitica]